MNNILVFRHKNYAQRVAEGITRKMEKIRLADAMESDNRRIHREMSSKRRKINQEGEKR